METTQKVSKHAKRRAAKKAQQTTENSGTAVVEEKTREAQIKDLEYKEGETKSNEEMKSDEPIVEQAKKADASKKGGKKNKNQKLVAPVFADKEVVVVSQENGFTGDKEEWFDEDKYNQPKQGPNFDEAKKHDYYFGSYSSHHIHEEMLKDTHRTLTYQ